MCVSWPISPATIEYSSLETKFKIETHSPWAPICLQQASNCTVDCLSRVQRWIVMYLLKLRHKSVYAAQLVFDTLPIINLQNKFCNNSTSLKMLEGKHRANWISYGISGSSWQALQCVNLKHTAPLSLAFLWHLNHLSLDKKILNLKMHHFYFSSHTYLILL